MAPRIAVRALLVTLCLAGAAGAGCGDEEGTGPDAAPVPDAAPERGRLLATWTLSDGSGPIDCATVGANTVTLIALPRSGGFADIDAVACADGELTSHTIASDEYDVTLELAGQLGKLAEVEVGRVTVETGVDTQLDPVEFVVEPSGNVRFRIDAGPAPGNNCDPVEAEGSAVTAISLVLSGGGECVPVTFDIGAGATQPAGSYEAGCNGEQAACIERDQLLGADALSSGSYSLEMIAYRGDLACFSATVSLSVPGGGLTVDHDTFQLPLTSKDEGCLDPE